MPTTPVQLLPYPALSDPANGPVALQNLALAVDSKVVMRFASAAARDTAIPAPVVGMLAYTTTENTLWLYYSAAWRAVVDNTPWTAYTPTWTAATTNPVIGNGTKTGWYKQIGKTVHFRLDILFGSSTTYGSGVHSFGLPVAAAAALAAGGTSQLANGAGNRVHGTVNFAGSVFTIYAPSSPTSTYLVALTQQVAGVAFQNGGFISASGTYEAA